MDLATVVLQAREILRRDFGISDLSTMEGVHLRQCAEESLAGFVTQELVGLTPKQLGHSRFQPKWDAVYRWLWRCFGFTPRDIWAVMVVTDLDTGEVYRLPWTSLTQGKPPKSYERDFDALLTAIEKRGHKYDWKDHFVDPAFRQYLTVLRERAHFP